MQNPPRPARPPYRERLTPSLWLLVSAAVVAPMIALTLLPLSSTVGLIAGAVVAAAIVLALLRSGPMISVDQDGVLHAGRAHIHARWLGEPVVLVGDAAREARGPGLPADGWHLIRGGVDGLVVVPNLDPDDPVSSWTISSRTPDRLAAALRNAHR